MKSFRVGLRAFALVAFAAAMFVGYSAVVGAVEPSLAGAKKKLVLIAGKPSHPPRQHEFNAGVQLFAHCLRQGAPELNVAVVLNGWTTDERVFDEAAGVVFYMDGGAKHEAIKESGARLKKIQSLVDRGVGIGCMHYAVEIAPDAAGAEFKRWIGGHYETLHSCNPAWEPAFDRFPEHPITRGVAPFQIKDEWYFNMRFVEGFTADKPAESAGTKFTPLLVAAPSDAVRNGPYVYPPGPYPHIQAAKGRAEAMMWAVVRPDGGRGFGFTGGHYHDNWRNDEFRKIVLNALVWIVGGEVPQTGVLSRVTPDEIEANLDAKPVRK